MIIAANDMDDLILPIDAFIRSVGVNRSAPHAIFLGAGASITSGVPSASMCIWEWKRDIFLTNNPGMEDQFSELSLPSVKERIQRWLDGKGGYPASGSDEEYSFYIRSCFPISDNRRAYFQEKVRSAKPHVGYHLLCFLQGIQHWRRLLFESSTQTTFEYPTSCASPFRFKIRRAPVFAKIGDKSRSHSVRIDDGVRPLLHQSGLILTEPKLRFLSADATRYVTDPHPLRGLVNNCPFDFVLTQKGLAQRITLGVVCPKAETRFLETYLHRSTARLQPQKTEEDYLVPYPGFSQAFRLPLDIPQPGSPGWETCPEADASLDDKAGTLESSRLLTKAIDSLNSTHKPDVVLIFIPERWHRFRRFETEDEVFDLHDFVEAYCVQKGVPTQFLEQHTLDNQQQCRVWWWLSLALYAKAMRTPWILDSLSSDTAFVGLGFSIDRKAPKGEHIILGCSHLYNAQGQGLQYRLSKIENGTIINDDPFMSREDACRVGETIRQLFFDAQRKLPRRVVIHKRSPFPARQPPSTSFGHSVNPLPRVWKGDMRTRGTISRLHGKGFFGYPLCGWRVPAATARGRIVSDGGGVV